MNLLSSRPSLNHSNPIRKSSIKIVSAKLLGFTPKHHKIMNPNHEIESNIVELPCSNSEEAVTNEAVYGRPPQMSSRPLGSLIYGARYMYSWQIIEHVRKGVKALS